MKKNEKEFFEHHLKMLTKDEQKKEIIESLLILIGHADELIKYSSEMLRLVEKVPANKLLIEDDIIRFYDLLGLEIHRSKRYFKQFEIKLEVYTDPKNTNK